MESSEGKLNASDHDRRVSQEQDLTMLDILSFFKEITGMSYCVVKMSENFPRYRNGEDIDLFCYSVDDMTKKILSWGDRYLDNGYHIKVHDVYRKQHVHIDFVKDSILQFRFDLYGLLPAYNKVQIKPALFESIIENAQSVDFQAEPQAVVVNKPSAIDDMLLRYLEFVEWYDVRPDKIKHLEYILKQVDDATRLKFLEKMHHYTTLPPVCLPDKPKTGGISAVIQFFKKCLP